MGSRFRHFCALMKKNWIVWKRTLGASLCELFCPVVLMAILAIARALISIDNENPQSHIKDSNLFFPADYLSNASNSLFAINATQYNSNLTQFLQFSNISFLQQNAIANFLPTGCLATKNDPARPIIAFTGPQYLTDPIVKQINDTHNAQRNLVSMVQSGNITDQNLANLARSIQQVAGINFTYQNFSTWWAIRDYIGSDSYMTNDANPGVCMGFAIIENSPSDYQVRLIFNDRKEDTSTQMIPSQLDPPQSNFDRDFDWTSFGYYTDQGYSFLHNWIANEILQAKVSNQNASIALTLVPFSSDKYVSDSYGLIMTGMLPFFMLLMYILPVYRLISNIVSEKESKARESMKMMGLSDSSYWLSWFTYYFIVVTIISILCLIILSPTVFVNSTKGIVFLYFWVYGLSLFGFCLLLQSFFSRARVAAITGTLIYFATSFVNAAVADSTVSQSAKNLASLLSTVAVQQGSANLALFETNGIGLTYDNIGTTYQNYKFQSCLVLMAISFLICVLLGLYFDNVLPSAYGLRKPWYFFCSPSYWMGSKSGRARIHQRQSDNEDPDSFETKDMKRENFEPVQRELHAQEAENKILKIADLQKTYPNGFSAVKGLNIKMYNGQIFALLGHNGAGKTTTISMLTGLVNSTGGHCEVFGYDLFEDMSNVRQFLGVCPQHDVLFDLLSAEEHLDIFCDFKGVDRKTKKEEIRKMLIDVDVFHSKDIEAKKLSGGNRRKLSVAIALIGGSKLVLLDEPTAGMDLSARRKLWNMLKNYKHNRIIILTTHYMDEADILGDRIGIMTGGKLICLGSSLFLKNRFGVGYNLTMVKKHKEPNTKVGQYLKEKIGEVKKLSEVSSEITYQIPTALSYKFKEFFNVFDQDLDRLDIRSYGISVTTLEEVFLKVGHGDDTTDDKKILDEIQQQKENAKLLQEDEDYSIAEDYETGAMNVFSIHFKALFKKRLNVYKRNVKGLITEIIIPIILVLIGFAFTKVTFFKNSPDRNLTPYDYPLKQRMEINGNLLKGQGFTMPQFINNLPSVQDAFDITVNNYTSANLTDNLYQFDRDVFNARLIQPYEPFRYGSYYMFQADKLSNQYQVSSFVNISSQDVAAYYPQFIYESILKTATNNPNFNFNVVTEGFPVTLKLRQRQQQANGIFIVFVVSIGFALIPASIVSFILMEREKNLKHMQLISGLDLSAYWISNLAFDIIKSFIPCAVVIGLMYAFGLNYDWVWLLFLLFPVGVIPFTYVTSFMFQSENISQTVTIFLHFVISGIGAIVAAILRMISSTYAVGDALVWVFKIIPSYPLTDAIMYQAIKSRLVIIRPDLNKPDTDINAIGGDILLSCVHAVFWTVMLILIETRALRCLGNVFNLCRGRKINERTDLVLDEDVVEEENRVAKLEPDQIKVRVDKFRKVYTQAFRKPFLAVEKTSFGLDYGECFALLGVNGAGKTTTFKSLTGEINPTAGQITINGMDIGREFAKVRKLIGYCPQHDAIFDTMSVEEHLEYYASLKGIRKHMIKQLVEKQIKDMNLEEHRKKLAGALSGGNKRKLSVAICVIGNPPIILLDEPSAGMDPEARRFMWSVVARISQQRKKSAVILTTHSMEEAEALSTKMGIMVKGGIFRCFGSSQHIKSKYGTGYEIEVKVRKLTPEDIGIMAQNYGLGGMQSIHFDQVEPLLRQKMIDPFLINELRYGGLGNDLVCEADEHDGMIECQNLLNWIYVEQAGMRIINGLCDDFGQVEILEHYNDYFKMRVPRGSKSIGFVFSLIENKREEYKISEYSASQTTLEQIFQTFANLKIDDHDLLKFHKVNGMVRQILPNQQQSQVNYDSKTPLNNQQQNYSIQNQKGGKGMNNF